MGIPFHPVWVHFPIALLCVSWLIAWIRYMRPEKVSQTVLNYFFYIGIASFLPVLITGTLENDAIQWSEEAAKVAEKHETLAYVVICFYTCLGIWFYLRQQNWLKTETLLFNLTHSIALILLFWQASLGGELVYTFHLK